MPLLRVRTDDPAPGVPADRGRSTASRQRVERRGPRRARRQPADRPACPRSRASSASVPRTELPLRRRPCSDCSPRPGCRRRRRSPGSRRRRRLALRPVDDGLHRRQRRPRRRAACSYSMTGVQLELSAADMAARAVLVGLVSTDYTQLPAGLPTDGAHPRQRRHPAGADPLREGRGAAAAGSARTAASPTTCTSPPGNGADDLVAFLSPGDGGRTRLLRAVRLGDGGDGPDARHPRPGRGRLPRAATQVGPGTVGVQLPRPARVAGAVLPRRRLGALRADAGRCRHQRARRTPPQHVPVGNPTGGAPDRRSPATSCPTAAPAAAPAPERGARRPRRPSRHRAGLPVAAGRRRRSAAVALAGRPAAAPAAAAPAAPRAPPGRRPRGRLGRAARHRARPRRAVARTAARRGRPATAWCDHFGAPVDDGHPGASRARRRTWPPTPWRALDRLVHDARAARATPATAAPRRPPSARAGRDPDLPRGAARRRARGARRRAEWWPRSVLIRARAPPAGRGERPVPAPYGGVVDHVG